MDTESHKNSYNGSNFRKARLAVGHSIKSPWLNVKKLGQGSYGTVYHVVHTETRLRAARKMVSKERLRLEQQEASVRKEIAMLRKVTARYENGHPNILRLVEWFESRNFIHIVTELCSGGDLLSLLKTRGRVNEGLARRLMKQLAAGLQVLRSEDIVHRDLKPANLLLTHADPDHPSCKLKIADFGFARTLAEGDLAQTLRGTPLYLAPELLNHQQYDGKADLWAVGCILFELLTGRHPFFDGAQNVYELKRNIQQHFERGGGRLIIPHEVVPAAVTSASASVSNTSNAERVHGINVPLSLTPACSALLEGLLRPVPDQRISFNSLFHAPFLLPPPPAADDAANDIDRGVRDVVPEELRPGDAPTPTDGADEAGEAGESGETGEECDEFVLVDSTMVAGEKSVTGVDRACDSSGKVDVETGGEGEGVVVDVREVRATAPVEQQEDEDEVKVLPAAVADATPSKLECSVGSDDGAEGFSATSPSSAEVEDEEDDREVQWGCSGLQLSAMVEENRGHHSSEDKATPKPNLAPKPKPEREPEPEPERETEPEPESEPEPALETAQKEADTVSTPRASPLQLEASTGSAQRTPTLASLRVERERKISYRATDLSVGDLSLFIRGEVPTESEDGISTSEGDGNSVLEGCGHPVYYAFRESGAPGCRLSDASCAAANEAPYVIGTVVLLEPDTSAATDIDGDTSRDAVATNILPCIATIELLPPTPPCLPSDDGPAVIAATAAALANSDFEYDDGKLSFQRFAIGCTALFIHTGDAESNNGEAYLAFNQGCPHYYLARESVECATRRMQLQGHSGRPVYVYGRIVMLHTRAATASSNPFALRKGTEYHVATVEIMGVECADG